jgi:hypothetical protein
MPFGEAAYLCSYVICERCEYNEWENGNCVDRKAESRLSTVSSVAEVLAM